MNRKRTTRSSPLETMESILSSSGFLQGPWIGGVLVRIQSIKTIYLCTLFFFRKYLAPVPVFPESVGMDFTFYRPPLLYSIIETP